jgi:hypothetical protein
LSRLEEWRPGDTLDQRADWLYRYLAGTLPGESLSALFSEMDSAEGDGEAAGEVLDSARKVLDSAQKLVSGEHMEEALREALRECRYPAYALVVAAAALSRRRYERARETGGAAGEFRPGQVREWTPEDTP